MVAFKPAQIASADNVAIIVEATYRITHHAPWEGVAPMNKLMGNEQTVFAE